MPNPLGDLGNRMLPSSHVDTVACRSSYLPSAARETYGSRTANHGEPKPLLNDSALP